MKTFVIILSLITIVTLISSTIFFDLSLRVLDRANIIEDVNYYQFIREPHRLYLKYKIYKKLSNLFAIISILIVIVAILLYLGYI